MLTYISDNQMRTKGQMQSGRFPLSVSAEGITVVEIEGLWADVPLRHQWDEAAPRWRSNYVRSDFGVVAMIIGLSQTTSTLFVYDNTDDAPYAQARLRYRVNAGEWQVTEEKRFPFEFTIELSTHDALVEIQYERQSLSGNWEQSEIITLQK